MSRIEHGIIADAVSLEEIYTMLKNRDEAAEALWDARSELGRKYRKLCRDITSPIPETQGFYLWGFYGVNRNWKNVYLGKSANNEKYNIRFRICEELIDERRMFERIHYSHSELMEHFKTDRKVYGDAKETGITRDLAKAGCSHIVWVSVPGLPADHVLGVEADLIEAMNPSANRNRPPPVPARQADSDAVFQAIRKQINMCRTSLYYSTGIEW
ncbi:MAG: hypothetical protein ABI306_07725 [Caulobacteraceae bacterium]